MFKFVFMQHFAQVVQVDMYINKYVNYESSGNVLLWECAFVCGYHIFSSNVEFQLKPLDGRRHPAI